MVPNSNRLTICVIGTGGIGMRHAQSFCRSGRPLNLILIDPNEEARTKAEQLVKDCGGVRDGRLNAFPDFRTLPENIDLAIVCTNSKERGHAVEVLLSSCRPRWLILEKFLFPRIEDYQIVRKALQSMEVDCWVNCVRRAYPRYEELKKFISSGSPVRYEVSGNEWSMASNLIHHLDEFAGLCECFDLEVSSDGLSWPPEQNKRPDYWEFHGEVGAVTKRGDVFIAKCESGLAPSGIQGDRLIDISVQNRRARILQTKPEVTLQIGEQTRVEPYPMPFQSETTSVLLEALCETGTCALPTYSEAMPLHLAVLHEFQRHAEEMSRGSQSYIPIT